MMTVVSQNPGNSVIVMDSPSAIDEQILLTKAHELVVFAIDNGKHVF